MGTAQSKSNNKTFCHEIATIYMQYRNQRLALIFSHEEFDHMQLREGNESDVKKILAVLPLFAFTVHVHQNLKKKELLNEIKKHADAIKKCRHHTPDCLLVIVLTHGDRGSVLWARDEEFYTTDVWKPFVGLHKTTKIFLFQSCRGGNEEATFQLDSEGLAENNALREISVPILPHQPDYLIIYSTVEGNVSKRDTKTGTVYIQSLCNQVQGAVKQHKVDILTLLTNVNCDVGKFDQTSTFTSFLHNSVPIRSLARLESIRDLPSTSRASCLTNDAAAGCVQTSYPRNGSLILITLFTNEFEKNAEEMNSRLTKLPGNLHVLNINMDTAHDLKSILTEVSQSTEKKFIDADSLLVMVIAEIAEARVTENRENLFLKTKHSLIPINTIWGHFTASQCKWLRGKPKLFFICDQYRTDNSKVSKVQYPYYAESIKNNADFFMSFCHGIDAFRDLLFAFEHADQEIMQLMTTVFRSAESWLQDRTGRYSHFQSTLRFQFYFCPPPDRGIREIDYPLLYAAEKGRIWELRQLLAKPNIDVNVQDETGSTPLILACKSSNLKKVEILVKTPKVKINILDNDYNGALHFAARNANKSICDLLVEHGAKVNVRNRYGNTPIYWPASQGKLKIVQLLVAYRANIHNKNKMGRQPLHLAASNRRLEVVKYLVEKGSDINQPTYENITVLYEAAGQGRLESVKTFVELGAHVDMQMLYVDRTALSLAAESGRLSVVQYLIQCGADVNTIDLWGRTPLCYATRYPDIFRLLLVSGAYLEMDEEFNDESARVYSTQLNWCFSVTTTICHASFTEEIVNALLYATIPSVNEASRSQHAHVKMNDFNPLSPVANSSKNSNSSGCRSSKRSNSPASACHPMSPWQGGDIG